MSGREEKGEGERKEKKKEREKREENRKNIYLPEKQARERLWVGTLMGGNVHW